MTTSGKTRKRSRLAYYRRVIEAYIGGGNSHLTFWHGKPQVNKAAPVDEIGEYYMPFTYKAEYPGPFDKRGVPQLNYRGDVGLNYNPIAIAQYALGHYNLYLRNDEEDHLTKFMIQADWLVENLEENPHGVWVWNHHFDWEYRELLKAPWYSALAQGQGLSVLVRAYLHTKDEKYADAAKKAFDSCCIELADGGVKFTDKSGYVWLEEVVLEPPTHILNGFMWALWGIHDYALMTGDGSAQALYDDCLRTLRDNLRQFDAGIWSLYEQSGTLIPMVASPFYHSLHIVQLRVMHRLTGESFYAEYADRWERYAQNKLYRVLSLIWKAIFKIFYY